MKHFLFGTATVLLLTGVSSSLPRQEEPVPEPAPEPEHGLILTPKAARAAGLESLRTFLEREGVPGPDPADLDKIIRHPQAAIALGKALFWDMKVGSDGVMACGSCHYHAGADNRTRNQINPGEARVLNERDGDTRGFSAAGSASDIGFEIAEPNSLLRRDDFPFVRDIGDGDNVIDLGWVLEPAPGNSNDVAGSSGVRRGTFTRAMRGEDTDQGTVEFEPVFSRGKTSFRQVTGRNAPSVINAVLNFHNFWDGRANNHFNGQDPFGEASEDARIWVSFQEGIQDWKVDLENSSLASQAVGPPLSGVEMSLRGREFRDIGRRVIPRQPLAEQEVAETDSVLGPIRHPSGYGLKYSYQQLIMVAFQPWLWQTKQRLYFPPEGGEAQVVAPGYTPAADTYHLAEANFALIFGLAIQMYESTLVSDDTPFDRWLAQEGKPRYVEGFGRDEVAGLNVFMNEGKCINCHSGPEMTSASVDNAESGDHMLEVMAMADHRTAIYDNGFYNIAVTPTSEDTGRGGNDPWGNPLAQSRQFMFEALGIDSFDFDVIGGHLEVFPDPNEPGVLGLNDEDTGEFVQVCRDLDGDGKCSAGDEMILQRVAVDGAFKTPGLRNQLLQGPYMHNGSLATLAEVIEFYDHGGSFCRTNRDDLDPDITGLGLTSRDKQRLLAFLLALTDDRVLHEKAPFDHPQIWVPDGHFPDGRPLLTEIPAVGAEGGDALRPFLNADPASFNRVIGDGMDKGDLECSTGIPDPTPEVPEEPAAPEGEVVE